MKTRLPTLEEIKSLPRWARVAFAVRCAQRMQPLVEDTSENVARRAIEIVAICAGTGLGFTQGLETMLGSLSHRGRMARRAALAAAVCAAQCGVAAREAWYESMRVKTRSHFARDPATDHRLRELRRKCEQTEAQVARHAERASWRAYLASRRCLCPFDMDMATSAMRSDFDRLSEMSKVQGWDDESGVAPGALGTLWPDGKPDDWPSGEVQALPAEERPPEIEQRMRNLLHLKGVLARWLERGHIPGPDDENASQ